MQTWSHSSRNVSSIFSGIHIERFLYNYKISMVYASAEFVIYVLVRKCDVQVCDFS